VGDIDIAPHLARTRARFEWGCRREASLAGPAFLATGSFSISGERRPSPHTVDRIYDWISPA
jgi:hypothetical protein